MHCFPDKQSILDNIDNAEGKSICNERQFRLLQTCKCCLEQNDANSAIMCAVAAGYNCMAQAIKIHYV